MGSIMNLHCNFFPNSLFPFCKIESVFSLKTTQRLCLVPNNFASYTYNKKPINRRNGPKRKGEKKYISELFLYVSLGILNNLTLL